MFILQFIFTMAFIVRYIVRKNHWICVSREDNTYKVPAGDEKTREEETSEDLLSYSHEV